MSPEEIEKQKVPLTERMVREPFWLGLITVMVVMIVIGVGYLVKKHLPDKIEKLLRTEMDSSQLNGGGGGGGYDSNTFSGGPVQLTDNSPECPPVHLIIRIISLNFPLYRKFSLHYSLLLLSGSGADINFKLKLLIFEKILKNM